jgi:hypothetical protein
MAEILLKTKIVLKTHCAVSINLLKSFVRAMILKESNLSTQRMDAINTNGRKFRQV